TLRHLLDADAGVRASERKKIVEASTGWLTGPSRKTRETVLRGMGAEERQAMGKEELEAWQTSLRSSLKGTELEITVGYVQGNPAHVLAARVQERLDKSHNKNDDDLVQAMGEIDSLAATELKGGRNAFMPPDAVQQLTNQMFPEFEQITA